MDRAYIPFRKKCIIKSCATNYCAICLKNTKLYHEVPARSREQWLLLCERKDLLCSTNSHRHIHICSNHFRDNDYYPQPLRLRLFKDAAPSRNLQAALCSHVDDSYFVPDEQTSQQSTSSNHVSSCLLEPLQQVKEEQPCSPFSEELNLSHGETENNQQTAMAQHYLETMTPNVAVADIEMVVVKEEREDKVENGGEDDSIPGKTEPPAWEEPNLQRDGEETLVWCEAGPSWSISAFAGKLMANPPVLKDDKTSSHDQCANKWMSYNNSTSSWRVDMTPVTDSGMRNICEETQLPGEQEADNSNEILAPFRFSCPHCQYGTNIKRNLQRHCVTHQSSREKPFSCDHCKYRTDVKTSLQKHFLMHDCDRLQERNENRVKAFACNHCDYKAYDSANLRRHLLTHDQNRAKPFFCVHCNYKTDMERSLQKHNLTHVQDRVKPLACDYCNYKTDAKSSFKTHLITHATEQEKPFACDNCVYRTAYKFRLRVHARTHDKNRVKPFPCSACDYRADSNIELQRHLVRHDSEKDKPFACHVCNYSTHAKSAFRRHLLTHSGTRNKPFACKQCKYKTDRECNLQNHARTHLTIRDKPFACSHCTYRTDIKGRLTRHVLTHAEQTSTVKTNRTST